MRRILKTFSILVPLAVLCGCGTMARNELPLDQVLPPAKTLATEALLESAKCSLVSGRPEAAEAQLKALIAARPDWWEPYTTLGVALDRAGRHAEALPQHDAATRLAPGKAIALANKGLSQALAGKLHDGVETMRIAANLPGAPARVRVNLAVLEALAGDGDRAATILSQESLDDKADGMDQLKRLARSAKKTGE